eukprot:scaffold628_cov401-Prasinococcus_capsulatus_cf.AAC.1
MTGAKNDKAVNVQVILRCRPMSQDEQQSRAKPAVKCNEARRECNVTQVLGGKETDRTFNFDKVFGPESTQINLYDQCVRSIVDEVLEGFNCTIFAYGQTGTGKTYTMEGADIWGEKGTGTQLSESAGVIPRAVNQIFKKLNGSGSEYSVKVTFVELYNEELTDLLSMYEDGNSVPGKDDRKKLALMEDGKGGVSVRGLEETIVQDSTEIFKVLEIGTSKRQTAAT